MGEGPGWRIEKEETYLSWINWLRHSCLRRLSSFLGTLFLAWVDWAFLLFGSFVLVGWRWFSGNFIFILSLLRITRIARLLAVGLLLRRRDRAWRVARHLGARDWLLLPILLRLAFGRLIDFILRLKTVGSWSAPGSRGSRVLSNRVIFLRWLVLVLTTPVALIRLVISLSSAPACVPFDGGLGSCAAQVADSL